MYLEFNKTDEKDGYLKAVRVTKTYGDVEDYDPVVNIKGDGLAFYIDNTYYVYAHQHNLISRIETYDLHWVEDEDGIGVWKDSNFETVYESKV